MLADALKKCLGSSFVFYVKAAGFHWNVEGPDFPQYHKFLGKIYEEVYSSIDVFAELIRQCDGYAPGCLSRLQELSVIQEQHLIPRAELMLQELCADTDVIIECLKETFEIAAGAGEEGIANFIAERIDAFGKHRWQLRSCMKNKRG